MIQLVGGSISGERAANATRRCAASDQVPACTVTVVT
ncbi:MAG: hypothetical protein JWN32_1402, partial [Solirubrobacterales bacterium]|nr:hypothetical protein [Solirubrobacterales bacterium]